MAAARTAVLDAGGDRAGRSAGRSPQSAAEPRPAARLLHRPVHPVRLVTATALFDGHDAAINVMRRILQSQGAEVVHLGHNRSVDEIVTAAVHEDVQGVAVSSYQGGHLEFFGYLVDSLRAAGRPDVAVFGGGGGVIVPAEIAELERRGVTKIFAPADGARLGLAAMVNTIVAHCDRDPAVSPPSLDDLAAGDAGALARVITLAEAGRVPGDLLEGMRERAASTPAPVLGVTGTGGSGKSSLTDEIVRRFRIDYDDGLRIAVVAVDPTRRRGGGALLGDRIRMNTLDSPGVFFRSMATRSSVAALPDCLDDVVAAATTWGADLVVVETPGIGQGDASITDHVDLALYVMTPEYGAASQLEKIDMLDFADVVAVNKFDRRGGDDALREVRRQLVRNTEQFGMALDDLPVFGTVAARFNDDGVTALYGELRDRLGSHGLRSGPGILPTVDHKASTRTSAIVPASRVRYLSEVAAAVRAYHDQTAAQVAAVRMADTLERARAHLAARGAPTDDLDRAAQEAGSALDPSARALLDQWDGTAASYRAAPDAAAPDGGAGPGTPSPGGNPAGAAPFAETLSGTRVPRVALPRFDDPGDLLRWLRAENVPGRFPFTAGVFAFKREDEDPARMFAGEGDPFRTNRRFHYLSEGQPAIRLSTAFDSVTLYGFDPDERPDIYGKIGNSGVSIATIDDMAVLFEGFDLASPSTSVSMTINGPAPTILAMFLNVAADQGVARFAADRGRPPSADEEREVRAEVLSRVRGTVQADILKEDQGQNTCILSTDVALQLMADIQEWFVAHRVRNFYSVSISGYHIAEAGANPISQLAFTLANGFTYVEAYLARGMAVDDFAPNLSFFFSAGMDPEYSVLGRVARRIWAVAMRDRYGAGERSQKLKYHVQTSGRSLHAQEMGFNDIRTTLQALLAVYDNCNSLHTNAYDEAVTTPTEESVRRALAIQMIINREWGLAANDNPLQGSFLIETLTDLVEEAVLTELDRLTERGGVLGAMEHGYQRGRIQDESLRYEQKKHDGSLPIVGVNTFVAPDPVAAAATPPALARSTDEEKRSQLDRLHRFRAAHAAECPAALDRIRARAIEGGNLFEVLMDAVRVCTLGEITQALFEVGGRYRRNV